MVDLTAYLPFVIGFFVVAAVAAAMSVAALVWLVRERRTGGGRVVPLSAGHPAVVATTRRAA